MKINIGTLGARWQTARLDYYGLLFITCVCAGSPYLNGTIHTGITNPQQLAIPGLGLKDYDKSGNPITVGVPYGPVYNAMREIATTYEIGMQITLDSCYRYFIFSWISKL